MRAKRLIGGQDEEKSKGEEDVTTEPGGAGKEEGPPRPTKRLRRTMKDGRPIKTHGA